MDDWNIDEKWGWENKWGVHFYLTKEVIIFMIIFWVILLSTFYFIWKREKDQILPCQAQKKTLLLNIKGIIVEKPQRQLDLIIKNNLNTTTISYVEGMFNDSIWQISQVGDSVLKFSGENKILFKGKNRTKELIFLNLIDSCK